VNLTISIPSIGSSHLSDRLSSRTGPFVTRPKLLWNDLKGMWTQL
jgi:hypothetical protein